MYTLELVVTYILSYTVLLGLLFISKAEHDNSSLHNLQWLWILLFLCSNLVVPILFRIKVNGFEISCKAPDLTWPHCSPPLAHWAPVPVSLLLLQAWLLTLGLHVFCSCCFRLSFSRYSPICLCSNSGPCSNVAFLRISSYPSPALYSSITPNSIWQNNTCPQEPIYKLSKTVLKHWKPEIDQGGYIYTMDIGKCYYSEFLFSGLPKYQKTYVYFFMCLLLSTTRV